MQLELFSPRAEASYLFSPPPFLRCSAADYGFARRAATRRATPTPCIAAAAFLLQLRPRIEGLHMNFDGDCH